MDIAKDLKDQFGDNIKFDFPLAKISTIRIGGPAKYFLTVYNREDLIRALRFAQNNNLNYFIVGLSSNIIFSDLGFAGVVIKNEACDVVSEGNIVVADSGIPLARLIRKLAEKNLGGLEFLTGIPGTLGGAVYGNAGAYGRNISELVDSLVVLDTDGKIKHIQKKQLEFNYRSSIFKEKVKNKKDKYFRPAILTVKLKVARNNKDAILRLINNFLKMRKNKYPKGYSVGSVFKNVEVAKHPAIDDVLKSYIFDEKLPAGVLLENIGAKKMRQGAIYVPQEHANFIINKGSGTAFDFQQLIENLKQKVYEEYGIVLEEEIEYVGQITKRKTSIWEKLKNRF